MVFIVFIKPNSLGAVEVLGTSNVLIGWWVKMLFSCVQFVRNYKCP